MRIPFFPVFVLLPVVELWLMIAIGAELGALVVILWLVAMMILGMNLLRYLGASSMLRTAQSMRSGGAMPAQALADNLFKALGAVLLIVPGVITDAMALLCFIPLVRRLLLRRWLARAAASARTFHRAGFGADAFRSEPFGTPSGNVYEHQGPAKTESDKDGVLIEQRGSSSSTQTSKND